MLLAGVLHSMHCVGWFFARRNGQRPEKSCSLRRAVYDSRFNIREKAQRLRWGTDTWDLWLGVIRDACPL